MLKSNISLTNASSILSCKISSYENIYKEEAHTFHLFLLLASMQFIEHYYVPMPLISLHSNILTNILHPRVTQPNPKAGGIRCSTKTPHQPIIFPFLYSEQFTSLEQKALKGVRDFSLFTLIFRSHFLGPCIGHWQSTSKI